MVNNIEKVDLDEVIRHLNLPDPKLTHGPMVEKFESEWNMWLNSKFSVMVNSGASANDITMLILKEKYGSSEIIVPPLTWVSDIASIIHAGHTPVFADIALSNLALDVKLIEKVITKKTKAIMPVSLYGQPPDLNAIEVIADKYNLKVIIDGAQSFGSTYNNKTDSNLGNISTTSFFPSKPLGCYGDGGAVFTNNEEYANKIKLLRIHGQNKRYHHKYIGIGGRLDTMQAAILLAKLPHFKKELKDRQKVADHYTNGLSQILQTPVIKSNRSSAWAQYTLRVKNRDILQQKLKENGIPTSVFYPIPLHLQECFRYLNYRQNDFTISEKASNEVISIPMNPFLTNNQVEYVCSKINENI
jgi:UDP-2-acetamido-2-deoxy-ribo-hexuluronate aminotransferase